MKINITPISIWTTNGVVSANAFEVRYINYTFPSAVADCHIWADNVEISGQVVGASAEQCDAWTDDLEFAAVFAANAGLTPTLPVSEWVAPTPTPTPTPSPTPTEPEPTPTPTSTSAEPTPTPTSTPTPTATSES